jgi:peptidoglycan/xylan/chitin deacetylase (PgdA/CDA1 family)
MGILKSLIRSGLSRGLLLPRGKRCIFVYHDISEPDSAHHSPAYSTSPATFRGQVRFLKDHFRLASLDEIVAPTGTGDNTRLGCITFDDGFRSVRSEAFPYLQSEGIPLTLFVCGMAVRHDRLAQDAEGYVRRSAAGSRLFLNEADVRYLSSEGVAVENHSASHRVLAGCAADAVRLEILGNKRYLEDLLSRPVKHFALPFGKREHYTREVLECCRDTGHEYVYSTNPTYFDRRRLADEWRPIPRIPLTNQSPEEILFLLNRPLFKRIDL